MALQLRRGSSGTRTTITPAVGELIYTTDTKLVYVGDGTTAGGTLVSSGGGGGGGINNVVEDTSPQLGGNLDVNGRSIVSASNGDINITANGTGDINLNSTVNLTKIVNTGPVTIAPTGQVVIGSSVDGRNGNLWITRNNYSPNLIEGVVFAQHHESPFATDVTLYKTRGTGIAPTSVQTGDILGVLSFSGYDGSNPWPSAGIFGIVEGAITAGHIPTKISFGTENGTNQTIRAELSSTGVWKVNSIQNLSGGTLTITALTSKFVGDVQINAQGNLQFADSDSSNYVGFQAPTSITSNVLWTLPNTDGTVGQVLKTDGAGTLSWTYPFDSSAPGSASATGTQGQIAYDSNYVYVCIATNTWKRAALATW